MHLIVEVLGVLLVVVAFVKKDLLTLFHCLGKCY